MKTIWWADEIIKELRAQDLTESCDAIINFIAAYTRTDGDEAVALEEFESAATEIHDTYEFYPHGNHYYFYIFPDGSVYYDGKEDIDRFYPSLDDLADEDDDFKQWAIKKGKI